MVCSIASGQLNQQQLGECRFQVERPVLEIGTHGTPLCVRACVHARARAHDRVSACERMHAP